jgi:hypothetical protein
MRDKSRHTPNALKGLLAVALVVAGAASASAQTASTTYRGTKSDPFAKFKPALKRKVEKKAVGPVAPPPIQARIDRYKALKQQAMAAQTAAPKPTTALTLSEIQVMGISRTPRGYAAMVEATPIHLSYVVYPGEQFYDGMLVAIEETRLVFRKQTRWSDGHTEQSVETKELRTANAVADSMAAQRSEQPAAATTGEASAGKSELTALVEALKAIAAASAQQQQQPQPQQAGHEPTPAPAQGRP